MITLGEDLELPGIYEINYLFQNKCMGFHLTRANSGYLFISQSISLHVYLSVYLSTYHLFLSSR
jgi:hypothetical protein